MRRKSDTHGFGDRGGSDLLAEFNQTLRPVVLCHKGSFGTRSRAGSDFAERLLTVSVTLRRRQRNILEYVTTACEAVLRYRLAPSLLPQLRCHPVGA